MWHYDFQSKESRQLEDIPAWAGSTYYVVVGGENVIPYWTEVDAGWRTTRYRISDSKNLEPLFSFDANWYGVARLR